MRIIQAPEVTQETMELIAKKAKVQGELDVLLQKKRERLFSLADLEINWKKLENDLASEVLRLKDEMKDLEEDYQKMTDTIDALVVKRDSLRSRNVDLKKDADKIVDVVDSSHEKEEALKQNIKELKVEREMVEKELKLSHEKLASEQAEMKRLEDEKNKSFQAIEAMRGEVVKRDKEITERELTLRVYEQRIMREHALSFPNL